MKTKGLWVIFLSTILGVQGQASGIDFTEINSAIPSEGSDYTYISGFSFNNKRVTYDKKSGMAFIESDIALGTIEQVEGWKSQLDATDISTQSIIITGDRFRWPNNIVPFQFSANVSQTVRDLIYQAIQHWEGNTNIEFVLRDSHNESQFPDFVNIINDEVACWSYVGRIGGRQDLNLDQLCGFGSAVHELGHVLGLWHEHSREDRDDFVKIHWDNILDGKAFAFNQHISDGEDVHNYDYGSIMHYGAYAFSRNGWPTITPLQHAFIGQRSALSVADIASIDQYYPLFLPVANLNQVSYLIYLGNPVFIDGRNSFDPDGKALKFDWDLGDGTIINQGNDFINHVYSDRGNYNVTLTVFDQDGNVDQETATAVVYGFEAIMPAINLLLLN